MRNKAIDMMRAFAMVLMVTVNNFWTVSGLPHILEHAGTNEDMMGLSDIVFPLFLFSMGMSIPYAIENKLAHGASERTTIGHILTRSIALLLMGAFICNGASGIDLASGYSQPAYSLIMIMGFFLVWNHYPRNLNAWLTYGCKAAGAALLLFLVFTSRNPEGRHFGAYWWGILGIIGWTYLACGILYFFFRERKWALVLFLLFFVSTCILTTPMNSLHGEKALLDVGYPNFLKQLLDILHMGNGGHCALAMGGIVLAVLTRDRVGKLHLKETLLLAAAAIALFAAATCLRYFFIISKNGSSITWVVYIFSLAVCLYTLFSLLAQKGWDGWFRFIRPAGSSTLTCYMIPYVFYALVWLFGIKSPAWSVAYPVGILRCVGLAFACVFITWLLGKIHIKLKI